MSKSLNIFGAGGHTRSLISLLINSEFSILGIYDENYNPNSKETINGFPLVGNFTQYNFKDNMVLSYGDNQKRKSLYFKYIDSIYKKNIYHSTGFIDETVELGQSNFVFANTVINSNAKLGDNNIINTGVIIEHEVEIGSHNHISVGAIICGRSKIGSDCFIGAGAVINDKIEICDGVTVGSNAVVITSIRESGVYVGNPVRKIR